MTRTMLLSLQERVAIKCLRSVTDVSYEKAQCRSAQGSQFSNNPLSSLAKGGLVQGVQTNRKTLGRMEKSESRKLYAHDRVA